MRNDRTVGIAGAIAVVAGSMLGIGIFLTPPLVATYIHDPLLYIFLWLAGGFIAYSGAVVYAELATRYPKSGGDYTYIRRAFGKSASFAAGTILYAGIFAGSAAAMAVPLAEYQLPILLSPLVKFEAQYVFFDAGIFRLTGAGALGIVLLLLFTTLNVVGTKLSVNTQLILTLVPVISLTAGSVYLLSTQSFELPLHSSVENANISFWSGTSRATLAIYFTYAGWNALSYIASEIKEPQKNIPISLFVGIFSITVLYMLLAATFYIALGPLELANTTEAGSALAATLNSTTIYMLTIFVMVLALAGSLNSTILGGSYTGFAVARNHTTYKAIAVRHSRFNTPSRSIWLMFIMSSLYITTGSFEMLIELTGLAMFLLSGLTVLSLFIIRYRSDKPSPYSATAYPWIPGFFLIVSVAIIGNGLYRGFLGSDSFTAPTVYPLIGLFLFFGLWAIHAIATNRKRARKSTNN